MAVKSITYVPVSACSTNQPASFNASFVCAVTMNRSSAKSAGAKNSRCRSCIWASRVSVNELNASSEPLNTPAVRLPVQAATTSAVVHPVSAKPAMSTRLWTRTGDTPLHESGAPISDWRIRWSEYASV